MKNFQNDFFSLKEYFLREGNFIRFGEYYKYK